MKIIISRLPQSHWWGNGVPSYEDNHAMQGGIIPDQSLLTLERNMLIRCLKRLGLDIIETAFPKNLDNKYLQHDFIYIRDQFITDQNGNAMILKFRNLNRKIETKYIVPILESLELSIKYLPQKSDLFAEGGEFYYCKQENILFSGLSRNSHSGSEAVAKFLNVEKLLFLESNVFHLDAYFSPVLKKDGTICAIICCLKELTNNSKNNLYNFANNKNIPILDIPIYDGIGTKDKPGSFAANSLPLPGTFLSSSAFSNPEIDKKLDMMGVNHIVTPLSQYALSGGAVHCCTNEL